MKRHRRPRSAPAAHLPLTTEILVAVATAAANGEPALVVLILDGDDGATVSMRPCNVRPSEVAGACRELLGLVQPRERRGPSFLISVEPGFGLRTTLAAPVLPEVVASFAEHGGELMDWLLVSRKQVRSVLRSPMPPA